MGRRKAILAVTKRHDLTKIKELMQIVLDYLQYEEAMKLYQHFKCREPIMPCLRAKDMYEGIEGVKDQKNMDCQKLIKKSNIKTWYFPFEEINYFHVRFFVLLDLYNSISKSEYNTIKWQCPICKVYNEYFSGYFNGGVDMYHGKKHIREGKNYLCECTITRNLSAQRKIGARYILAMDSICVVNPDIEGMEQILYDMREYYSENRDLWSEKELMKAKKRAARFADDIY